MRIPCRQELQDLWRQQWQRAVRVSGLLGLVGWLAVGCTSFIYKTAYNQADFLVMRELNRYFSLSSTQREFLKPRVDALHSWHRRSELPRYVSMLGDFRAAMADGLTAAEIQSMFAQSRSVRDVILRKIYPDTIAFLEQLDAAQLPHIRERFAESNEELAEKLKRPVTERADSFVKFMDDWTGGLSAKQERQIRSWMLAVPDSEPDRLRFRQERQAEFLESLPASGGSPEQLAQTMRPWFFQADRSRPAYYRRARSAWQQSFTRMLVQVDTLLTAEQRSSFLRRLDQVIVDLHELSRG